jgi:protein SCO1/2
MNDPIHGRPHLEATARVDRRGALLPLLFAGGAALLGGCATARRPAADPAPTAGGETVFGPDGTRTFPNHLLRDQDGREVRFHDDLVRGQVFAATFGYASCKGVCTRIADRMGAASELIAPIMANPVRFYTFSLAEDSPAELRASMKARGLYGRPGWSYLTGPAQTVRSIRWAFGFGEPDEEADASLAFHTGMARFGNHPIDKWSSCPAMGNPVNIARMIVALFPPSRRPAIPTLDFDGGNGARPIPGFRQVPALVAMR